MPPPEYLLSRQLEEFGLPLVAGGLADQPMGYLADVMRARSYLRAREAREREYTRDDEIVNPAPPWAWRILKAVEEQMERDEEEAG